MSQTVPVQPSAPYMEYSNDTLPPPYTGTRSQQITINYSHQHNDHQSPPLYSTIDVAGSNNDLSVNKHTNSNYHVINTSILPNKYTYYIVSFTLFVLKLLIVIDCVVSITTELYRSTYTDIHPNDAQQTNSGAPSDTNTTTYTTSHYWDRQITYVTYHVRSPPDVSGGTTDLHHSTITSDQQPTQMYMYGAVLCVMYMCALASVSINTICTITRCKKQFTSIQLCSSTQLSINTIEFITYAISFIFLTAGFSLAITMLMYSKNMANDVSIDMYSMNYMVIIQCLALFGVVLQYAVWKRTAQCQQ